MTILIFVFATLVVFESSLMDVYPNISSNVAYMYNYFKIGLAVLEEKSFKAKS